MFKSKLGERFKKAREFLGLSQNAIAKNVGVTNNTVRKIELEEISKPNWDYVQFLIEQGVNPYYLIGKTNHIEGQNVENVVSKEEYEQVLQKLQNSIPKTEYEKLLHKYEALQETFKLMNTNK